MGERFNENLKIARERKGLSQKAMAERIGVAKSTYSLYESGNREPNVQTIKKIADILNVSADELLGINDESQDNYKKPGMYIGNKCVDPTPLIMGILENVAEMPIEKQEMIYDMVKGQEKRKKNVVFIPNPQRERLPNNEHKKEKKPFTNYEDAVNYLKGLDMLAACDGKNLSEEAIIQMANAILLN